MSAPYGGRGAYDLAPRAAAPFSCGSPFAWPFACAGGAAPRPRPRFGLLMICMGRPCLCGGEHGRAGSERAGDVRLRCGAEARGGLLARGGLDRGARPKARVERRARLLLCGVLRVRRRDELRGGQVQA